MALRFRDKAIRALAEFYPITLKSYSYNYVTGTRFEGELVYYPSAYLQRAVIKTRLSTPTLTYERDAFNYTSFAQVMNDYADALSLNPFLERFPVGIAQSTRPENTRLLDDLQGHRLSLTHVGEYERYQIIAGGKPMPTFGEWNGMVFRPLTKLTSEGYGNG